MKKIAISILLCFFFSGGCNTKNPVEANQGPVWTPVLINKNGGVIGVSGSTVYVGTGYKGIFVSTDNGNSWAESNYGVPKRDSIYYTAVTSFAVIGKNVFAGTEFNTGVLLSSNDGNSWTTVNTGLDSTAISDLGASGKNLFAGNRHTIYLSTNSGTSWNKVQTGLPEFVEATSFAFSGSNVFAGCREGIFLTTNNGVSWIEVDSGLTNKSASCLTLSGTNLSASSYDGVYISTNNGGSWSKPSVQFQADVFTLTTFGANLYAGNAYGVFLSADSGANWSSFNVGLSDTLVTSLGVSGSYLVAGVLLSGVWRCPL